MHGNVQQESADQALLAQLGYRQELRRGLGAFESFALSFSIISILTGAVQLYGWGLQHAGPLGVMVGWVLVSLLTIPMAASLAQLASAWPTAGALYHWATLLGGPAWGFATAWLNTLGQVAITASIDYGLAEFVVDLLGMPKQRAVQLAVYALFLVSHAVLNHLGVRAVELLSRLSAWYHLLGVAIVVAALASWAPLQPLGFLTLRHSSDAAWSLGFGLCLLQAAWTFTGYDASAHVTEETVDPTRAAPRGMMMSVLVSAVAGLALLVAVTLSIGDLQAVLAAPNAFVAILRQALGERLGSAMVWLCVGAMWFCGLGSLTSNSRMLFAFARDGGLPQSKHLAKVSVRFQTPHVAVWVCTAAAFVLAIWSEAYTAMTALSTIALYASYALPIGLGWRARHQGRWRRFGPFDLGRWSGPANALALAWCAVAMVLFVLPPNQLAGLTFAATLVWLGGYWWLRKRGRFKPPVHEAGL